MREKSTMPASPSERLVKSSWTGRAASRALPSSVLSTVLDDLSRYIITLKLCTMKVEDVTRH